MSEALKPCPICEKGNLHEREYQEGVDRKIKAPLYFAECDACGSEQADAEHLRKNKRAYETDVEFLKNRVSTLEDDLNFQYTKEDALNIQLCTYEAEIEALKDELKDAHQQTGLAKIDLDHKNVLLLSCEKALEDRDILNASLKQKLSVALEALKIGHDCAIKLTDFDEIPLADRRYSGIEVIARAIQQVEGNEPYPLQSFKKIVRIETLPYVGSPKIEHLKGMMQQWSDGSWRQIEAVDIAEVDE